MRTMAIVLMLVAACRATPPAQPQPVVLTALAASSLTDVLPVLAAAWHAQGGESVSFSFDSSSKLAKEVEAGAPADLLFTADADSMDLVDRRSMLVPGSRRDLASNTLVVVVAASAPWSPATAADLASDHIAHLAVGGENVPAGKYARASLTALGVWSTLQTRAVSGDNVRTTLQWVARGDADAGVVYATDAKTEPGVRVAFALPDDSHPPIVYPGAVLTTSAHVDAANAFLAYCASADGAARLAAAGFRPPSPR